MSILERALRKIAADYGSQLSAAPVAMRTKPSWRDIADRARGAFIKAQPRIRAAYNNAKNNLGNPDFHRNIINKAQHGVNSAVESAKQATPRILPELSAWGRNFGMGENTFMRLMGIGDRGLERFEPTFGSWLDALSKGYNTVDNSTQRFRIPGTDEGYRWVPKAYTQGKGTPGVGDIYRAVE